MVCFHKNLVGAANWLSGGTVSQSFAGKTLRYETLNVEFKWNSTASTFAPVEVRVADIARTAQKSSTLPTWSSGECILGGIAVLSGDIEEDKTRETRVSVRRAGTNGWTLEHQFHLQGDGGDIAAGFVCFRSVLDALLEVVGEVAVPCGAWFGRLRALRSPALATGRGGVALNSKYNANEYTCTAHGFGITTDLHEDGAR